MFNKTMNKQIIGFSVSATLFLIIAVLERSFLFFSLTYLFYILSVYHYKKLND